MSPNGSYTLADNSPTLGYAHWCDLPLDFGDNQLTGVAGEFFDLEALSEQCAETGRYTFFFNSVPLDM